MDRYWVGGTANWDATAGTKWALTSGGAGGQAVPTASDDVYFDAASGVVTVTVSATATCKNLNFTGFTGTFAGSSQVQAYGNLVCGSGMTWSYTGTVVFVGPGTLQITSNGKTVGPIQISSTGSPTVELQDAFASSGSIIISGGTFTTNNFNVTATSLSSSSASTRTINLGSSTVTLSGSGSVVQFGATTGMTFNAGTSTIVLSSATSPNLNVASTGLTFYDVSFTGANATQQQVSGANTFRNLTVSGRTSAGIKPFIVDADQTINGTLTLSAGTNATMRTFVRPNSIGTTRTLTCAAVASLQDIDFRDITIAGAAAPVSGTRLGDCKNNSGITFPAAKTVYYRGALNANWNSLVWSSTNGGTADNDNFPLAQDTAIFPSSPTPYPTSGNTATINAAYNIGTIDMSARTSNTMTLATGTTAPSIYGNWINGTGTTLTGTGTMTFAGRGSQTITSAGKTFTQLLSVDTPGGSVTLQDALTCNRNTVNALQLESGTLDANDYNITLSGSTSGFNSDTSNTRTFDLGSATLTIAGAGNIFDVDPSTNFTFLGTGVISLTSTSGKAFYGGDFQNYPTLNQGGTGTLTILGSNKFAGLTNTAIGRIQFTGGTTNAFTSFTISGALGNLLQLGSTNTTQAILQKPTAWNMGVLSMDMGNNTGLNFLSNDGTMEYLSVSYINGTVVAPFITATILESVTANSSESSFATFNPAISELAAGSDAASANVVFLGTLSETASAADLAAAGLVYLGTLSESATASEINGVIEAILAAILESASAQDLTAVVASTFSAAAAEIASSLDSVQAAATFATALAESAQTSDAASGAFTAATAISESATASELSSSLAVFGGQVAELVIGLDAALVASSTFSATAFETAVALDLLDAPGSIYNTALSESSTISDFLVGGYLWNPVDDTQNPNWQNVNTAQSVTWTEVSNAQNPGWVVIPTAND